LRAIGQIPADWKPEKRKRKSAGLDHFGQQTGLAEFGRKRTSDYQLRYKGPGKMTEPNNSATREISGRFLPAAGGTALNGGGNQWHKHDIVELRAKYRNNLPELMEILLRIARYSTSERTQISAISELLDRLVGKPPVTIDAVTTRVDVAGLYLAAMKKCNSNVGSNVGQTVDIEKTADTSTDVGR
jgi:hypothetical protein